MLLQLEPHHHDEKKLIALAKQGRQQLKELWSRERQERRRRRARRGASWTSQQADED